MPLDGVRRRGCENLNQGTLSQVRSRAAIMAELSNSPSLAADGFTTLRRRGVLLSLTLSFSVGTVASTIYVPSVPAIARALDTSIARVQFTFVGYLLAYAISMLVLGPLSDPLRRGGATLFGRDV